MPTLTLGVKPVAETAACAVTTGAGSRIGRAIAHPLPVVRVLSLAQGSHGGSSMAHHNCRVKDFSRKEKVLLVLSAGDNEEKSVGVIRDLAVQNGLREIQKWNISQILSSLGSAVVKLPAGWFLTPDGRAILERIGVTGAEPTKAFKPTLRKYASAVSDESTRQFIDESITALDTVCFVRPLFYHGLVRFRYCMRKYLKIINLISTPRQANASLTGRPQILAMTYLV